MFVSANRDPRYFHYPDQSAAPAPNGDLFLLGEHAQPVSCVEGLARRELDQQRGWRPGQGLHPAGVQDLILFYSYLHKIAVLYVHIC
jgi:hypothetical protein